MGAPGRALLGALGSATASSTLEAAAAVEPGWLAWPANGSFDFNQSALAWGLGLGAGLGLGGGGAAAAMAPGGLDSNISQPRPSAAAGVVAGAGGLAVRTVMEEKNWPALLILVIIALTVGGNILVILAVSLEKKLQNATNFFLRSLAVADMLVGILVMPVSLINILYASPHARVLFQSKPSEPVLTLTIPSLSLSPVSPVSLALSPGVSMPIPVIGLNNKDKVFVNGSCVMNEERFMLIGSFVAFFIPLVIMVVSYCLTIQVLQRQASVFLYESKTSFNTTAPPTSLPDPPTKFHIPKINTIAPPDCKEVQATPPQSRRNTLSCLKGVEPGMLLRASPTDSVNILPCFEAASQLSSPAIGPGRGDSTGCHGRRGMMQAIKNERRASKVLGIVFFLFLIMWCPFFITNVTFVLCQGSCNEPLLAELLNVFVWVGYISSGVNPLVYTLFNKTYRRAFSSYIRCRYQTAANAAAGTGPGSRGLLAPSCSSHAPTPLLTGGGARSGAGRGSNSWRNGGGARGSGGGPRGLTVDPDDLTDDGRRASAASASESQALAASPEGRASPGAGAPALSETETEMEMETDLSVASYSPSSRELTSSV
ncbi:5-hydroxytryptamine (serotonin) receptor 2C, G protein-coupled-like 1 [Gadus macrocephalus]|uniref:5-hydroxytryptamine (serotonin) receptor 2C, G protein-coupled-like 1 n=1 Tax=Gadus macrocephalus TaxID=80720 RepID=UPI0028CB4908|nr:5-hydroxytryptamine (serotonin) receptor 2C, G protein-coupled-like 1 [Gadus macrocephalus]